MPYFATHVNKRRTLVLVSDMTRDLRVSAAYTSKSVAVAHFGTLIQTASLPRKGARFTTQMSVDDTTTCR